MQALTTVANRPQKVLEGAQMHIVFTVRSPAPARSLLG